MKSPCSEMRRARPLLGTIVDIQARAPNDFTVSRAMEDAFAAIERVHRLMSFHDTASDVSRINREAHCRSVAVDPWTWQVLQAAQNFADESDGAFDVTIGELLARWNFLPRLNASHPERARGTSRTTRRLQTREVPRYARDDNADWREIVLEQKCTVHFRRRLTIDLGGIAKGFAVDCAIDALKKAGADAGLVNAGGDLRAFGLQKETVRIRYPLDPIRAAAIATLQNRALATSATYFSRKKCGAGMRSAIIDGQSRQAFVDDVSISIAAGDCMTADALTKIVFALREGARPILAKHRAAAIVLERDRTPRLFSYAPGFNPTQPPV